MKLKSDNKTLRLSDGLFSFLMLLPAIFILGLVVALPILKGIFVSFCDYKIKNLDAPIWNQFENYQRIFRNAEVLGYLKNTVVYVACTVLIELALGLVIALLLNSNIRGVKVYRGFFLIPWTIPSVVVAILWRWMLQPQCGVINYLLYHFGITDSVNIAWNMSASLALPSVILASVWRQLPYMMVMILAGLQSVDTSLVEASKIDGANGWQSILHITIPSIRPVLASTVWISIMNCFQQFTIIYNMTGGGPMGKTTTLGIAAYNRAFVSYNFGEGAAIGVVWLVFLFALSLVYNRINQGYADSVG